MRRKAGSALASTEAACMNRLFQGNTTISVLCMQRIASFHRDNDNDGFTLADILSTLCPVLMPPNAVTKDPSLYHRASLSTPAHVETQPQNAVYLQNGPLIICSSHLWEPLLRFGCPRRIWPSLANKRIGPRVAWSAWHPRRTVLDNRVLLPHLIPLRLVCGHFA